MNPSPAPTLFYCSLALLLMACGHLFYFQLFGEYQAVIGSDIKLHTEFAHQQVPEAYSLLHQCLRWYANAFDNGILPRPQLFNLAMIFALLGAVAATVWLQYRYFQAQISSFYWPLAFVPLLVGPIFLQPWADQIYLGLGTPNPWHNPTYLFAKPFALALFAGSLRWFEGRQNGANYLLLGLLALLSMWAKPSFSLAFLPAIAFFGLWQWGFGGRPRFGQLLALGIALLPSLALLWWLNRSLYTGQEEHGLTFAFAKVWSFYVPLQAIPLKILLASAFPLFVLGRSWGHWPKSLQLSLWIYLFSLLIFLCLAEKGPRFDHANFIWTYYFGLYFIFLTSLEVFFTQKQAWSKFYQYLGYGLLFAHLFFGLFYFAKIFLGGHYL